MSKKDASITLGADATAVQRAMYAAMRSVNDAGASMKQSINDATRAIVSDLGNVVLAQGKVNFSAQHAQVREFESATAKMSVSSRRGLEGIGEAAITTGLSIGKTGLEVIKWTNNVQQLSYSSKSANTAMIAMAGFARETGREVDQYAGLAVQFAKMGVEGDDVNKALGVMSAQAKAVGIPAAALADMFSAAGDSVSQFAEKGVAGLTRVTGLMAAVKATGLDTFATARVSGKLAGMLQGDTLKYERILGRNITDEKGHVKDAGKTLYDVTAAGAKYYGGSGTRGFERFMVRSAGGDAELGMARVNMLRNVEAEERRTGKKIGRFGLAEMEAEKSDAQKRFAATPAGQREAAGAKLFDSASDLLKASSKLGTAADALQGFASHNPILSTVGSGAVAGGIGAIIPSVIKSLWSIGKGTIAEVPAVANDALAMMGGGPGAAKAAAKAGGRTLAGVAGLALSALTLQPDVVYDENGQPSYPGNPEAQRLQSEMNKKNFPSTEPPLVASTGQGGESGGGLLADAAQFWKMGVEALKTSKFTVMMPNQTPVEAAAHANSSSEKATDG